jgi:hypothetical protein
MAIGVSKCKVSECHQSKRGERVSSPVQWVKGGHKGWLVGCKWKSRKSPLKKLYVVLAIFSHP